MSTVSAPAATEPGRASSPMLRMAGAARRGLGAAVSWLLEKLPEFVLQVVLIVVSIVLALAVDEWNGEKSDRQLTLQSLDSFEQEIRRNQALLEDDLPYRTGVRDALVKMDSAGKLRTPEAVYALVGDGDARPPMLLTTAWQTAVTTGTLRQFDFAMVSALSRTYTRQEQYERSSESRMPEFLRTGMAPPEGPRGMVRGAIRYMNDATQSEQELTAIYAEVLSAIAAARRRLGG